MSEVLATLANVCTAIRNLMNYLHNSALQRFKQSQIRTLDTLKISFCSYQLFCIPSNPCCCQNYCKFLIKNEEVYVIFIAE